MNDNETVAELVGIDRREIDDYAFYMLGLDRKTFHLSCNVTQDQDRNIFKKCWTVFNEWQDWLEDFSRLHNS